MDEPFGVDLKESVYALDTTTIDLCLSVFPWAPFRTAKAAVKLHTLLDLRGNIPTFIHISDGKMHEVNILDQLLPEAGAFYIMDRGFLDFERLYRFHKAGSFFVTRGKSNLKIQRRYSHPIDRATGLICDQTVMLTGFYSRKGFEAPLRRIRFKDPKTAKTELPREARHSFHRTFDSQSDGIDYSSTPQRYSAVSQHAPHCARHDRTCGRLLRSLCFHPYCNLRITGSQGAVCQGAGGADQGINRCVRPLRDTRTGRAVD